jgi:hypothetical protein
MGRSLLYSAPPQALDETYQFQEICGAEAAFAVGQCGERVLRPQVSPAERNLTKPAFFIDKRDSVFTAVFFAAERLKLTTGQRMKWMDDPKSLGFYSTNACSATPFPYQESIPRIRSGPPKPASASDTLSSSTPLNPVPNVQIDFLADSKRDILKFPSVENV